MDEQLKRRLVGATIVVALLVIFVPMLFEDKSAAPAGNAGEIPPLPEAIEERTIELPKSAADVVEEERFEKKDKAPQSGYRIVPLDEAPPKPPKVEPAPETRADASASGANLEAPADEEDAEDVEEEPTAEPPKPPPPRALSNVAEKASPVAKPPVPARPSASPPSQPSVPQKSETAPATPQRRISAKPPAAPAKPSVAMDKPVPVAPAKPSVAAAKPAPAEPATPTPPAAATSWTVQAGSFSVEANALALAEKLRKQNLAASVHPFHGPTATLYRVTVGPEASRARAEQIQKQIEAAAGIRGIILPQR